MTLKSFLYLVQLEEYNIARIKEWLNKYNDREIPEIKHQLIWTTKIKLLSILAKILFFLPPRTSVIFGIHTLSS